MFSNFVTNTIKTSEAEISLRRGGQGYPLLLLHGYPQTHVMWHKIASRLARDFTVVTTDLRGYGDSSKPRGEKDHYNYSKRVLGKDQVEVMEQLGYQEFYLAAHDRGARVAHRLSLDYPNRVKKLVLMDIAPTWDMYTSTDREFATAYYHWFFLIQPFDLPERLIAANAEYYLQQCLESWSKTPAAFTPEAMREYQRCFANPATIHGSCEDYRASASIDLRHDEADREKKISCPLLVLWGDKGIVGRKYELLSLWQQRAINVQGKAINCGHFLPEEAPEATYKALKEFL